MRARRLARDTWRAAGIFLAIAIRPHLWWVAVRQTARIARPGWWRRAPFLPLPDADYLRFRLETGYGAVIVPPAADLVAYLEWCAPGRAGIPRAVCRGRR
jgi:hypothetical protein